MKIKRAASVIPFGEQGLGVWLHHCVLWENDLLSFSLCVL
jgi:hypothetical protein